MKNKKFIITTLILIPILMFFSNYIAKNYGDTEAGYFAIFSLVLLFIVFLLSTTGKDILNFIKSSKIEFKKITWQKNEDTLSKMWKTLAIILSVGITVALMDKGISMFINFFLLH